MSFLLLFGGWVILVAAIWILPAAPVSRTIFVLSGLAVEVLGLLLAIRSHRTVEVERG